jgi:hypothetical protein
LKTLARLFSIRLSQLQGQHNDDSGCTVYEMKKLIVFLAIISALGLVIYHGPRLLDLHLVRAQVAARLSAQTGWEIDAAALRFDWFPAPHFSLAGITMNREGIALFIPETRIYPRWSSFLRHKLDLGELSLMNPEISVASWPAGQVGGLPELPRINITITNGTAVIAAGPYAKETGQSPLVISAINSRLHLTSELAEIKLDCTSSAFAGLLLKGRFKTADGSYQLDYEIADLNLSGVLPVLLKGQLEPRVSGLAVRGRFSGQGLENYRMDAAGDFPCFIASDAPEKLFLDCGEFSLTITRTPQDFTIDIDKLQLKDPGVTLTGKIAAGSPPETTDQTIPPAGDIWLVDLQGENLDLTSIREKVLALWSEHQVARTVCDIVLGGSAHRASYYFRGPLADFENLENMTIKVEVAQAEIHPPETKLYLREASGPIEISDGYLSGHDLRARLGDSRGSNCTLYLDLLARGNEFRLDLDIEADVADLPQVLLNEVEHRKFQDEVRLFSNCEGRAKGHLNIGEHLHDLAVQVQVDSLEARGRYSRLPWPFSISQAALAVKPTKVTWSGVKGTLGPNLVHDSAGAVTWDKQVSLKLNNLIASLDLDPTIKELSAAAALPAALEKAVTKAEGPLELKKAEFSGVLSKPESWLYSIYVATKGSRWTSPLLPQSFLVENAGAIIGQDRIDLVEGKLWFIEQPLLIEGSFLHNQLQNWQGKVTFSGTIRDKLAAWVRDKNWIPADYFPRIPCTLDKLRIEWDRQTTSVNGTIKAGMGTAEAPEVRLDLIDTPERFSIRELVIASGRERGRFTLDNFKGDGAPNSLSWQGNIDETTVSKILTVNVMHSQRLEGDFALQLPLKPDSKIFQGWLKVKGLQWALGDSPLHIILRDLNLRSQEDDSLLIEKALIDSDDSRDLEVNGTIRPIGKQLEFALNLTARKLTGATVAGLTRGLEKLAEAGFGPEKTAKTTAAQENWTQKGTLQFKIEHYETNPEAVSPAESPPGKSPGHNYVLSPAKGYLTFFPTGGYALDLRSSKLCGIDISGTIYNEGAKGPDALNFFTDSASPPLMQDLLPCLGFENTMIEGPLNLDGSLRGTERLWQSGKITILSNNGYIRRLSFLAKVFSVVNLTDLFSEQKLPQLGDAGYAFSNLELASHVENNRLIIDKAVVKGQGLNLFGQGSIDLKTSQADLIIMVAPLKTIDAIITNLPIIGQVAGGRDKAVISIPVGIKGDLNDPSVSLLPPEAIGEGIVNLITNTLKMPLAIFTPLTHIGQ